MLSGQSRLTDDVLFLGASFRDSSIEVWDVEVSDAPEQDASLLASFFAPVVAHDLGDLEGGSCWLFNDPREAGTYKVIARVEPRDVVLVAAQIHDNCANMRAVSGAKLYLSTDLLVVVYLSAEFVRRADDVRLAFDSVCPLVWRPYDAVAGEGLAPLWVGLSHLSNSPAIPFEMWTAAGEDELM